MNTANPLMDRWTDIDWKKTERNVWKLQARIYRAEQREDVKTVRKLQKLLMKSRSAKLLAVRKVTQENQGKKTAGIDGVKSLPPDERKLSAIWLGRDLETLKRKVCIRNPAILNCSLP